MSYRAGSISLGQPQDFPKVLTDQLSTSAREVFDQRSFVYCPGKNSQMFDLAETYLTFRESERVRANALHAHGGICASDIAKCHGHGDAVTLEHLRIDDAESVALHVTASI